jgi:hypothetical protein
MFQNVDRTPRGVPRSRSEHSCLTRELITQLADAVAARLAPRRSAGARVYRPGAGSQVIG